MYKTTETLKAAKTNDKQGLRVSTYATDYIYQGKSYSFSVRITIPSATNVLFLFDYSAITDGVTVYTPTIDATTGPINVDYYVGSDYADSTATEITPNNRASYGGASGSDVFYGAPTDFTGSTKGTMFSQGLVLSGHKQGGSVQESLEFYPPQATNILVELDNTNGTDATALVSFLWYEV